LQNRAGRSWPPAAHEAVLTARPASTSGEPTTPAPDCSFNIEFTSWTRVETILDFGTQPGELLAALLLMQDRGDYGGFAAAIPALAYLRSYEFLERRWESYGDDWRHHRSIEDTEEPANQMIVARRKKGATAAGVSCRAFFLMVNLSQPATIQHLQPRGYKSRGKA
jgi:hypothetical protein